MDYDGYTQRRRWYQLKRVWILGLFLIGTALTARWLYAVATAKAQPTIDYSAELERLARAAQNASPDAPDGWQDLIDACAAYVAAESEALAENREAFSGLAASGRSIDFSGASASAPPELVSAFAVVNEKFEAAGGNEMLDHLVESEQALMSIDTAGKTLIDVMLPELGQARALARFLRARMVFAAVRGDSMAIAEDFARLRALARALRGQPILITQLVGIAIDALSVSALDAVLPSAARDPAALARLETALTRRDFADFSLALEGERVFGLDMIQQTHTDNGSGDGRLVLTKYHEYFEGAGAFGNADGSPPPAIMNIAGVVLPSKKASIEKLNEFHKLLRRYREDVLAGRPGREETLNAYITDLPWGFFLIKTMAPAISRAVQTELHADQLRSSALMSIAAERYKQATGEYPEDIAAAIDAHLTPEAQLLVDLDRTVYRRLEPGEDPAGRSYVIASKVITRVHRQGDEDLIGVLGLPGSILNDAPLRHAERGDGGEDK